MRDQPVTASAVISFIQELEASSSSFYQELSERFPEYQEMFLGFAEDSTKNKVLVTRTYQETISDALEAGFSFEGLTLGDYVVDLTLSEGISLSVALETALDLEEKAIAFYLDVAERSQSLLATIPTVFRRVAKRRTRCKLELGSLHLRASRWVR